MNVCLICQQMSLLQFQIVTWNMSFIHIKVTHHLGFMTNKTETLQEWVTQALTNVLLAFNYAEENNLTNTQEFINFLDKLNELSVKY